MSKRKGKNKGYRDKTVSKPKRLVSYSYYSNINKRRNIKDNNKKNRNEIRNIERDIIKIRRSKRVAKLVKDIVPYSYVKPSYLKHMALNQLRLEKVCKKRKQRREILFRKGGVGKGRKVKRYRKHTEDSKVRC